MDIPLQSDSCIGVPQHFGQRFDLKPHLNGSRRERVPERMRMNAFKPARLCIFLKPPDGIVRLDSLYFNE